MKCILLTILITILLDVGFALIVYYIKQKQLNRDKDLFYFKLHQILEDTNKPTIEKVEIAKELCRITEGDFVSGAYQVLDSKIFYIK